MNTQLIYLSPPYLFLTDDWTGNISRPNVINNAHSNSNQKAHHSTAVKIAHHDKQHDVGGNEKTWFYC